MSFFRYDLSVRSVIGQAVDGATVAVLNQPATFPSGEDVVGTPLATIWAASSSNSANITDITWQNGLIDFTFDAVPADVLPGSYFSVSGADPSAYDGIWQVDSVDGDDVFVSQVLDLGTYVSGGTVATSAYINPFTTDNLGNGFFYIAASLFTVQVFDPDLNRISPLILTDQSVQSPGSGSVTSVALTAPAEITVAGSPITTDGTIALTWTEEDANLVFAGPVSGGPDTPGFRALVADDIPSLDYVSSVALSATVPSFLTASVTGSPVTSTGTLALAVGLANQSANLVFAGPASGSAGSPAFRALVTADLPSVLIAGKTLSGSADALTWPSVNFVTTAGVDGMTLAAPVSGTDNFKTIRVVDAGGHAHTITTSSNGIVPSHHLVTFNGTVGSFVDFQAFNGLWFPLSSNGVTIS